MSFDDEPHVMDEPAADALEAAMADDEETPEDGLGDGGSYSNRNGSRPKYGGSSNYGSKYGGSSTSKYY